MRVTADYQALITSWLSQKPTFVATIGGIVNAFDQMQQSIYTIQPDYDLDVADGPQLDVLGQWIGFNRIIQVPLPTVYFSYDTTGLGFDQGSWGGSSQVSLQYLDDDTYRLMLRIKIIANEWDGTIVEADAAYNNLFALYPGSLAFVKDNLDMTMTVAISGVIPPAIIVALFLGGYFPFKPMAVAISYFVTSVSGDACFGFDVNNTYVGGWDSGAWALSEGQ